VRVALIAKQLGRTNRCRLHFLTDRRLTGLRRRRFNLCRLRRLLSEASYRAARSRSDSPDRHWSRAASGMEAATVPGQVPPPLGPSKLQHAPAPRERLNRIL
jgi:hypothetical protein